MKEKTIPHYVVYFLCILCKRLMYRSRNTDVNNYFDVADHDRSLDLALVYYSVMVIRRIG